MKRGKMSAYEKKKLLGQFIRNYKEKNVEEMDKNDESQYANAPKKYSFSH